MTSVEHSWPTKPTVALPKVRCRCLFCRREPADGGSNAWCLQGNTYAGSPNEICGGLANWGATQLEAWRPACTTCGGHGACDPGARVCACEAGYRLANPTTCVPV